MADLEGLLRAFHDAVTDVVPLATARELVRGDESTALARLRVYADAYVARIAGVLAKDFPKLQTVLGIDAFAALTVPYMRAYPTHDPSLREAGAHLAAFLGDAAHADLARLERARVEMFDGPDAAPLSRESFASVATSATFPSIELRLVPSSVLLELAWNADEVWDAIENGNPVPAWQAGPRSVLVWRRDLIVIHRTLEPDEAIPLRTMARGGCIAEILEQLAGGAEVEPVVDRALVLMTRWIDAAIVAAP